MDRVAAKNWVKKNWRKKPAQFSPSCTEHAQFLSPHSVIKRWRPQIHVRMQANDENENENGAIEGLAHLNAENPYQGAPIHREEQFLNSNC